MSSTPDLSSASDTGSSNTDNITTDATPTFVGTATAGDTVTLTSDQDGVLGSVVVPSGGTWSFTPSSALSSNLHSISAFTTDLAGNNSISSSSLNVNIDTSASSLSITTPIEGDGNVNASEDSDVLVQGSGAESGAAVTVNIGGINKTITADSSGIWTLLGNELDISALNNGSLTVSATQTDSAGNTSTAATTSITLDNSAPNAVTITTPIETDGIVNAAEDNDVLITGSGAEANASVTVTISDGANNQSRTVTADGSGAWTFSGSEFDVSSFNDGTLSVSATQSDTAGNISTAATTSITLDNSAPNTVTITTPIETDGIVNAAEDGDVLIQGSGAESNASITVTISNGANNQSRTVTSDGSGAWTLSGSEFDVSSFNNGTLSVSATQSDAAGNISTAATTSITLDNSAPNAVTITTPIETDGIVNAAEDSDVFIQGDGAESGATVTVSIDGVAKTTTADSSGNWTLSGNELDISALNNGTLTVSATQTDSAGNTSTAATTSITLDNSAPNTVTITTPIETDGIVNATEDSDVLITGSGAEGNASVTVTISDGANNQSRTVTADGSGAWTLSGSEFDVSSFNDGTLSVSATQSDAAGNTSTAATTSITLDNSAPNAVTITTPIETDGIVNAVEDGDVLIQGSGAEANTSVTVTISDGANNQSRTVAADGSGAWTLSGSEFDVSSFNDGTLSVSATQSGRGR